MNIKFRCTNCSNEQNGNVNSKHCYVCGTMMLIKIDTVVESVRSDLLKRSELGIKKYGFTLDQNPLALRDWLQHAYEECLDQANYLKCAILKLDNEQQKGE